MATVPGVQWRLREDLSAEVCEAGDTVYVKPLVHLLKDNRVPLLRVKEFLGSFFFFLVSLPGFHIAFERDYCGQVDDCSS
jgi:hypothetical protein